LSEPFVTSETTEGAGTGAPEELRPEELRPEEPRRAPRAALGVSAERFVHALTPANETAPPPPPEPANSDLAREADADAAPRPAQEPAREPAHEPAQAWPLAWLRLVEPEPSASDDAGQDEVVAAVNAAEPADADGIAHAFGRAMAAALDPEPVFGADELAMEPAPRSFYSVPVVEPLEAPAAGPEGLSTAEVEDVLGAAATPGAAAWAEETAVAEPEEPSVVTPVYAARRAAARRAAAEAEPPGEGQAGEGGAAAAAYLFYLAGFLLVPAVAGVLLAYNARRTAPAWLQSHYLFLIRTFWIGLTGMAVAAALLFSSKLTLGGLVLGLLLIVWLEMRSAMGFIQVVKLRGLSRPHTWLL
jgi:uncharacterized membrane protein